MGRQPGDERVSDQSNKSSFQFINGQMSGDVQLQVAVLGVTLKAFSFYSHKYNMYLVTLVIPNAVRRGAGRVRQHVAAGVQRAGADAAEGGDGVLRLPRPHAPQKQLQAHPEPHVRPHTLLKISTNNGGVGAARGSLHYHAHALEVPERSTDTMRALAV